MQVKIDTREKFHVITINESKLAANMTAELDNCLLGFIDKDVKNVVLNMEDIENIDSAAATHLLSVHERFYELSASFVICNIQPTVTSVLEELELTDILNTTPTESEAWDIVQMEEIERELMGGDSN